MRDRLAVKWCRLRHLLGRRGATLLAFGVGDLIYGYWLWSPADPNSLIKAWFSGFLPLGAWALIWWTVGIICIAFAFTHDDYPGFAAAIAIKLTWAGFSFVGWLVADINIASVGIWGMLALIVTIDAGWREHEEHGEDAV